MIKKLVSHLGEYKRAAILTPIFSALESTLERTPSSFSFAFTC